MRIKKSCSKLCLKRCVHAIFLICFLKGDPFLYPKTIQHGDKSLGYKRKKVSCHPSMSLEWKHA
jgi:hypothetical protein